MGWNDVGNGRELLAKKNTPTNRIVGAENMRAGIGKDIADFVEHWKNDQYAQIVAAVEASNGKPAKKKGRKVALNVPKSALSGMGGNSERALMMAFGWYWEPVLHDFSFFEDMMNSVSIIDGSMQKLVDFALSGFKLQCDDPEMQQELEEALINDPVVDLRETMRSAMLDLYALGNCYKVPVWMTNDDGRKVPKVFRPIRVNALRKLRDEDLALEGFVQLLHRPSEFIMGTPSIPTFYSKDDVLWGQMRTYGWYAYGRPLLSSIPFVVRLKLVMERDLAEMLHQHVPRIDITFTPDEQMNQEQSNEAEAGVKADIAALKPTDNFIHTPDVKIEYAGPAGKGLDFANPQKHIENQIFYVLPFAPAIMGLDSTANPYDSQERWTISCTIANSLRDAVLRMFRPAFKVIEKDWGMDPGAITVGWQELDPENQQQLAMSEEYHVNNATMKRDQGFIDQDTAAKQATAHQKGGPVKQAAEPGAIPPPTDPNKIDPATGKPFPPAATTGPKKVTSKDKGPKKDGRKVPQGDKRPAGKRHAQAMIEWTAQKELALSAFQASPNLSGSAE